MMLRKPSSTTSGEETRRGDAMAAANGFGASTVATTSDYGNLKGSKQPKQGMQPHLSPYFMDLDEFCQSTSRGDDSESCSSGSTESQRRRSVEHDSDDDPAGLFPNSSSAGGHSRLFIPTSLPHVDQARPSFLASPSGLSSRSHSKIGENRHHVPAGPPALLKTSETLSCSPAVQDGSSSSSAVPGPSHYSPSSEIPKSTALTFSSGSGSGKDSHVPTSDNDGTFNTTRKRAKRRPREYVYNPKPFKQKAIPSSRMSALKDETYWDKRLKNNVAAKRSRENRRKKEIETVDKCSTLERENAELRERISTLEKQNAWLEGKLTKFLLP